MIKQYGPCPRCGEMFKSRYFKVFCTLRCYTSSYGFKQQLRDRNVARGALHRETIQCLHCGVEFTEKKSRKAKFCCKEHSRAYYAARFDRWIAAPQEIALPQAFDEFLMQEELPCIVKGCGWLGKSLGMHVNTAHGISAREFKKLAGFNLSSGLVTPEVSRHLSERPHLQEVDLVGLLGSKRQIGSSKGAYRSLEAKEKVAKVRADSEPRPPRPCDHCGNPFQQPDRFARVRRFCSENCSNQDRHRRLEEKAAKITLICGECKSGFTGSHYQVASASRGSLVFCSMHCRQANNGRGRAHDQP